MSKQRHFGEFKGIVADFIRYAKGGFDAQEKRGLGTRLTVLGLDVAGDQFADDSPVGKMLGLTARVIKAYADGTLHQKVNEFGAEFVDVGFDLLGTAVQD